MRIDELALPEGSTLESLVTTFFPEAHEKLVPANVPDDRYVVVLRFEDGPSYTITIRGNRATVDAGEADAPDFWMAVDDAVARAFVRDALTSKKWTPSFAPAGDVQALTDPRMLKRFALVDGRIALGLPDFPGGGVRVVFGTGKTAKKGVDTFEPDVLVEATLDVFERLLSGALAPDAALTDGGVKTSGKRMLAMQYAFGMAPLAPSPDVLKKAQAARSSR